LRHRAQPQRCALTSIAHLPGRTPRPYRRGSRQTASRPPRVSVASSPISGAAIRYKDRRTANTRTRADRTNGIPAIAEAASRRAASTPRALAPNRLGVRPPERPDAQTADAPASRRPDRPAIKTHQRSCQVPWRRFGPQGAQGPALRLQRSPATRWATTSIMPSSAPLAQARSRIKMRMFPYQNADTSGILYVSS
jgi:hypothetical protein